MKKINAALFAVLSLVVTLSLLKEVYLAEAACSATELSSCAPAFTSSSPPSAVCCSKLKAQKPCFCQYLKDPNLKQYVSSPNAKKVASTCGVTLPKC
ncbi:non-specific lipid-transfer protein 2-like [Mangifera indica]|uniref:non-specific lipid-transfer protein 2-like n=1 Tax=Mangifera indica TaxID=29780 RepID=UPI001CF9B7BD|nr:non-specific lipid-transfer protein 2-like [Mangifera indica]